MRIKKLLLISCFFLLVFTITACGRRGDPIAIAPYKVGIDLPTGQAGSYREIGFVKDLKTFIKDAAVYLSWGMPDDKDFPEETIKGFIIFRADIAEGVPVEECKCLFRSIDFIEPDSRASRLFGIISDETFEYLDKKAIKGQSYVYKIVIKDKNNNIGKDSNLVLVRGIKYEPPEVVITPPEAPTGVIAVYTQKNIVLTWDEIRGKGIKFYKIYRLDSKGFVAIGETSTSAFTDKNIASSRKYYYRVTAVSDVEGPPSKEIEVATGTPWN